MIFKLSLIMSNLRATKTKGLYKHYQTSDAIRRESRHQGKAKETRRYAHRTKQTTPTEVRWLISSLVLDDENNLGPDYGFLTSAPSLPFEEDTQGRLMSLTDLLNEIATVDQTLENNLLFTQYIDEDSQLFDMIYGHEGPHTDTAELFGDLGTIFNLISADQEALDNLDLDGNLGEGKDKHALGLSQLDSEWVQGQIEDAEDSLVWPEIPEADESCDEEKSLNRSFETTDQTMLCSHSCMLIAGGHERYIFTPTGNEDNHTEYVGRKRNVE